MSHLNNLVSNSISFFWKNFFLFAIVGFELGLIFLLNHKTPLISDDFVFIFKYNTLERINSPVDLVYSMTTFYLTWGGRILLIGLEQVFVILDKIYFNILNTFLTVLFFYLVLKVAGINVRQKPYYMFLVLVLFWFFTPTFGQDFFWLCGVATYLWGTLLTLAGIYIFDDENIRKKVISSKLLIFIFLVFSILTGNTMENLGIGLILFQLIYWLFIFKERREKLIFGFSAIMTIIGYIILIISPGNFVRMKYIVDDKPFLLKYTSRFTFIISNLWNYFSSLLITLIPLTLIYLSLSKKQIKFIALLLVFLSSFMSMIMSPIFPERAWLGPVTFLIVILLYTWNEIENHIITSKLYKYFMAIIFVCLLGFFSISYKDVYKKYSILNLENNERIEVINKTKNQVNDENTSTIIKNANLKIFTNFDLKYNPLVADITEDPEYWINKAVASYYGIDEVTGVR